MALPTNLVPPARKGPVRQRKSGAGTHAQGVRRQRTRGAARRASISREMGDHR
jgi:hypothetical protein